MPNKRHFAGLARIDRIQVDDLRRERDQLRHINNELAGELKRLRAALERIAANTCCDKGEEATVAAREALRGHIDSDGLAGDAVRHSHRRGRKWSALWR